MLLSGETDDIKEPISYEEACKSKEWQEAMEEEIMALKRESNMGFGTKALRTLNPYHAGGFIK